MNSFKLLIVEDDEGELATCKASVERYEDEKDRRIELIESKTLADALTKMSMSLDGIIIDLKLGKDADAGIRVVEEIHKDFRIPIAIHTATPDTIDSGYNYIGTYKKAEQGYDKILDDFFAVYDTGLTKITGGRGIIEKAMNKVFWKSILPYLDSWKDHSKAGLATEKSLLRFTISHLHELLNDDSGGYLPEETYITPFAKNNNYRTGSIVQEKETKKHFIVLTPACDLVIRDDGQCKTDKILLCEICTFSAIRDKALENIKKPPKKQNKETELLKNNYRAYYHWLPKTSLFVGGFINFRWLLTLPYSALKDQFNEPECQISSHFIKDIISRFSAYYARQGQPDFDHNSIAHILNNFDENNR